MEEESSLMTDRRSKALTADLELPHFETTAFTPPPPLAEATVAIVTTAALHHPEQPDFAPTDTSFRVLDGARRDVRLGHWSPNFDTSGFAVDLNVVFPVDRLAELRDAGRIGAVADRHLSFAGNQFDLTQIRLDDGPAAAKVLRDDGVDVVLLTPV
jgi:D-proline reductase (dithiol) PrdB